MRSEPVVRALVAGMTCLVLLAGCRAERPQAVGTLEFDRITLPAPAAERIVSIDVREGERVTAGQRVLSLEVARTRSTTDALQAQAQRQREVLAELEAGPRSEAVAQARAQLVSAQAQARNARAYYDRLKPLAARQLVAMVDVDRARAASSSADAQVSAAQAALAELRNGSRREQVAQGEAAVRAADAQVQLQQITLDKLALVAPRAGRIESLPYKLGDQAPVGTPLAILLVGDAPYARIYVSEQQRANVKIGDRLRVIVDGRDKQYEGRVRMIRSEPSFTPYYALIGKDAARLSYLAEVALGPDAADLPAGLPVRVEIGGASR